VPAAVVCLVFLSMASTAAAQSIELAPFYGYRFGESVTRVTGAQTVDDDGGPSFGVLLNVPVGDRLDGVKFEALFSRERANVRFTGSPFDPPTFADIEVDHYMIGGIQELEPGKARPFIGGLLGLTRYEAPGDSEVRFTLALATGAKFFATKNVGLRVDARIYMTVLSLNGGGVCAGGCVLAFNVNPTWQADLTAGLVVAF
jgi:hypothetical protein